MSVYSGFLKTAAKKAKKKSRMSAWGKAGLAAGGVAAAGGLAALIAKHRNKPSMWTKIRRAMPSPGAFIGAGIGAGLSKAWYSNKLLNGPTHVDISDYLPKMNSPFSRIV